MSGDIGLEQPIVFYSKEMTESKKVLLRHKGIQLAYLEIENKQLKAQVDFLKEQLQYKTFGKPSYEEEEK